MHEVVTEAIKALEQEPCDDCISRQDAKNVICDYVCGKGVRCVEHHVCRMKKMISELPPVTPQPKTGHWVFDEILDKHYYCSECKSMGVDYWDYCPNCGAKMKEGD